LYSMNQLLLESRHNYLCRRGLMVMFRNLLRRSPKEFHHGIVAQMQIKSPVQVHDPGQCNRSAHGRLVCAQAKSQFATSRMSHDQKSIVVQIALFRDLAQKSKSGSHVFESARPASAGISYAPILQVPRCHARLGQGDTQMSGVSEVILRPPKSAVDHHHRWIRWPVLWNPQITELVNICAVAQAKIGRRRCVSENVLAISHAT